MLKKISPILALHFVNILGFSILIPIMPSIVETYQGSEVMYGILISIYSMFQFFASPIMGTLSDVYGRRPVLILSQAGTLISWIIFGLAFLVPYISLQIASLPILVITFARIFDGLTGGNTTVANAYISDVTTKEERTKAFGLVGAVFGVGFLIGPVIGAWSYSTSITYAGTAITASIISLITLLFLILKLPESLPPKKRKKKVKTKILTQLNLPGRVKKLKLNKSMKNLFTLRLFFSTTFSAYTGIIILHLDQYYQLTEKHISLTLIGIGIYAVFNQTRLVPKLAKKIGELKTHYIGYISFIFAMFLISVPMPLYLFIAALYIVSFSVDSCLPTFKSLISNYFSEQQQGEVQGIDEAFLAVGRATAPILSAAIYATLKGYTFAVIALFTLMPLLFLGFVKLPRLRKKATVQQFDNIPFNED